MTNRTPSIAPLEDFVAAFNSYEAEAGIFSLRDEHGVQWWDLVRYRVQFELCVERGVHGRSTAIPSPILVRAASFIAQAHRLVHDVIQLNKCDTFRAHTLIVSQRSLEYIEDVTAAKAERGERVFFVSQSGDVRGPNMAIKYQSVHFVSRMLYRLQRLPPDVAQEARRLADDISKRFNSEADIFGVIVKKYREELIARRLWSFILGRARAVERVLYVNDDTLKSLVILARARGIDTEEVQHGYMGRTHIGFSYPPLSGTLATLPNRVIVTRDSGDITYPVEHAFVKKMAKERSAVPRTIDVLIGSSPTLREETQDVVAALVGKGLRVALKLHPAETRKSSAIVARYSAEEVTVHPGDQDFCDLAWQAHVFIPVNATSTTAFEAADMGARVVMVDFRGIKKTGAADAVTCARASSLHASPEVVRSQLQASSEGTGFATEDEK